MTTDGAEMLLDLGLPATLIGGIVLPLLGVIPDSAMIVASGVGGSKEEANKQIAVGMGCVMHLVFMKTRESRANHMLTMYMYNTHSGLPSYTL